MFGEAAVAKDFSRWRQNAPQAREKAALLPSRGWLAGGCVGAVAAWGKPHTSQAQSRASDATAGEMHV
eukprot:2996631-Pleurochrysis_carterae.AAC.1